MWIEIVIFACVTLLAFGFSYALNAVSYAVGAIRFAVDGDFAKEKESLPRRAKHVLERSTKVGAFCILGVRIALVFAVLAFIRPLFLLADWLNLPLSNIALVSLLLSACVAVLFLHQVFCDLHAAANAARSPFKIFRRYYRVYFAFWLIACPLEFLARRLAKKIFGAEVFEDGDALDHIDVRIKLHTSKEESDELTPYAKKIVRNSIRINELDISDVMVPRNTIEFIDTNDSFEKSLEFAIKCGHTRYPLCRDNLDHCLGIIRMKEVFACIHRGETPDFMGIKHAVLRVKQNDSLIEVLSRLRKNEMHIALVEDEFGGVIGMVTLAGIVEEIVGQIKEEHPDSANDISRLGKNIYRVSGLAAIHNVEDFLGVDFENDEVSTFGGLVTQSLGRFPEAGEKLLISELNMRILVEEVSVRRVLWCKIEIIEPEAEQTQQ